MYGKSADKAVQNSIEQFEQIAWGKKPPKKPTRKPIPKDLREKVWLKYMGNKTDGKCYCCRIKPIHFTDFEVGHNKAVSKGGYDHISNLRPICRSCNRGMGTKSIEWYRKKYYAKPKDTAKSTTTKKATTKKAQRPKKQEDIGAMIDRDIKKMLKGL